MNPLNLVPSWLWALAVATLTLTTGIQTIRLAQEQVATASVESQLSTERMNSAIAAQTAEAKYRKAEKGWQSDKETYQNDAQKRLATLSSHRAAAVTVGDQLRNQLTACRSRPVDPGTPQAPGAGPGSPATDPTADLRADVLRRLDRAAEDVAEFADRSRIAGQTCERSYESVTR